MAKIDEDHPLWKAIDAGGGQGGDVEGVLREIHAAGFIILSATSALEPAIRAACIEFHAATCSWPNCECVELPDAIKAALAAPRMRVQVYDIRTNQPAGTIDIPNDVLEAAAKVEQWMRVRGARELHGLRFAGES